MNYHLGYGSILIIAHRVSFTFCPCFVNNKTNQPKKVFLGFPLVTKVMHVTLKPCNPSFIYVLMSSFIHFLYLFLIDIYIQSNSRNLKDVFNTIRLYNIPDYLTIFSITLWISDFIRVKK